jgi:cysteine-rich repeat protein
MSPNNIKKYCRRSPCLIAFSCVVSGVLLLLRICCGYGEGAFSVVYNNVQQFLVQDFEGESDVREFGECNADADSDGPWCGNSIIEQGEECDDGNANNQDACTNQCQLARCGDNIVQAGSGEQCDVGDLLNNDNGECTTVCQRARCGDNFVQPGNGEECDDGNERNGDGCSSKCKIESGKKKKKGQ